MAKYNVSIPADTAARFDAATVPLGGPARRRRRTAMVQFRVPVPDDIAARFDAVAARTGGRLTTLRRLINSVVGQSLSDASKADSARTVLVSLKLSPKDAAAADAEASAMGLKRTAWIAALVRRRVRGAPTFGRPDDLSLIAIIAELGRIGLGLSQAARAAQSATQTRDAIAADLTCAHLEEMQRQIRGQLDALYKVIDGNLAYWSVG